MKISSFNRLVDLDDGQKLLVNSLSGALDIVSPALADILRSGNGGVSPDIPQDIRNYLLERRYLLPDGIDEPRATREVYERLGASAMASSALQAVLILGFGCNLRCVYCWQRKQMEGTPASDAVMSARQADLALAALDETGERLGVGGGPATVQLFGGEPLLPRNTALVRHILERCREAGLRTQVTTNGAHLADFLEMFDELGMDEVQVTVDGPAEIHEARRVGSDFAGLMAAMDALLANRHTCVKLRVNVDRSNLTALPRLAEEIIDRQWYANRRFQPYLAPLRDACGVSDGLLRRRAELLSSLLGLTDRMPRLEIFDLIGWDGFLPARSLAHSGRLPMPKTSICDAARNQVVFTPEGLVHLCAEVAHDPDASVGRYDPRLAFDETALSAWRGRTPLDLDECATCALRPQCGGGCMLFDRAKADKSAFCDAVAHCFDIGFRHLHGKGELA
ncbi:4Fe4S-binding SPASM domain containing protein [Alkalidesulfovibrio alkalitolerans DSM 16529]|uniref:4Fe4S-binding SPASM domain containing protein n=1 Tax=Alkalidesulfovibrio alkalitolerans DSM 16529 TaxID=1121439 RepID=S7TCP0_9BACT|nr:radical SAM protein [Alkalidesulfovibrio alkalitolerans]EPR34285.1 4Fe4S-binding SPASM domain containing protein [Alkalidesulfovibrio alkalitolerans DSM 16529]